jgi:phospholipid/cholesterol/gamma-HCH transport system substrate-binding protein
MGRSIFETIMGALVLVVAGGFMAFAYEGSNLKPVEGYPLKAKFSTVAGIGLGSDVRIGGIKVGVVSNMELDPVTYQAIITLQMKEGIRLPEDSSAAVVSDGLLGSKYIKLDPGAEDKTLPANGVITITQSAVNLEELIGKMAFGNADKGADGANNAGEKKPAQGAAGPTVPAIKP